MQTVSFDSALLDCTNEWYVSKGTYVVEFLRGRSSALSYSQYIYINDLPNYLGYATPRLFADDTSIIVAGESVDEMEVKNGWKQVS